LICWLVYVVVIVWFIWSMISMVYVKHYKQYSIKYFLREQKHMKYFLREQNLEEVIQVKILVSYLSNNFVEQTKTTYNLWTYSILNYYIMIAVTNNNKPWYLYLPFKKKKPWYLITISHVNRWLFVCMSNTWLDILFSFDYFGSVCYSVRL
jgi:hypothetical protein